MWERIGVIVRKEFRQAFREPRMRAMLLGPPLIQLLIFGFAVNLDVENCALGWLDQDNSYQSRELRDAFVSSGYFRIAETPATEAGLQDALDRGRVQAFVHILPGFSRDTERGRATAVQIIVDGTNSNTASIIGNYATRIVSSFSNDLLRKQMQGKMVGGTMAAGGPLRLAIPSLNVATRVWFNPELRSRSYFVPGVVVNIIMLVTLSLTALAIVREKEIGTMEQLMVTPIRPLELIIGKTLPFACVGLFDMVMITLAALIVFHVPFRGQPVVLLVATLLFLMSSLGAGLFLSTISHTQQQAMMSSFFFFQPAFMLSGFTFPIRNMPLAAQWLSYLNPVRYFMEIVRGVFLKGTGFPALWPQMLALLVFGVTILGLSTLRFHKRLD
jgi:ABC-2 type transport system permease protein